MLTFAAESFAAVESELRGIITEHWEEVASDREGKPLDPNWELYRALDAANHLVTLTVRDSDRRLVGYIIHLLYNPPHYRNILAAHDDAHFLRKEHRRGLAAVRMFKFAEVELRKRGVGLVSYHTKARSDINKGTLFERMGYKAEEVIFAKRLNGG